MSEPVAYRLEWRPGDYCFFTPKECATAYARESARVRGLFREPQPGCDAAPAVFFGRHWIAPKYARGGVCPEGYAPLYLGPVIHEPGIDEEVALLFPSIAEARLEAERPELFKGK